MPAINSIILDGTTLTLDPEEYKFLDGARRGSVHKIIDGTTVFQDRGFNATDMAVSFSGLILDAATVGLLMVSYRKTAYTMRFQDWYGNDFQVVFTPGQKSLDIDMNRGSSRSYKYSINLSVVSVTKFVGSDLPAQS